MFISNLLQEMFAQLGAQAVPTMQPVICRWYLQLKMELFNVKIRTKNVVIIIVAMNFSG